MGGKTAWGVKELVTTGLSDDPAEINKIKSAATDFQRREEDRLNRLREMDAQAERILEDRKARRSTFDMPVSKEVSAEEIRRRQDEALKRMRDAKEAKRNAKRQSKEKGEEAKKIKKKKQKKEASSSSSSSASSSASSSSSSSSSASKTRKKGRREREKVVFEVRMDQLEKAQQAAPVPKPAAPLDPETKRKAEEARLREKEVKKKAKEQAAAWRAEVKRKEVEAEAKRQADLKRKEEDAVAKRKADEEAKKKAQEEEPAKAAQEAEAKNAADAEERKKLFSAPSGIKRDAKKSGIDRSKPVIGGYFEGQTVYAAKDITVRGNLVIKRGCAGLITGPAENNPTQRIAVEFSKREDRLAGVLNVVPSEIKKTR